MDNHPMKMDTAMEMNVYPQMLQSMAILQMNSQELTEHIRSALDENPLLEELPRSTFDEDFRELCRQSAWLTSGVQAGKDSAQVEYGITDQETEGLAAFLEDQLDRLDLEPSMLSLCQYLAQLLDENGWLDQTDMDILPGMGVPARMAGQALDILQSLEPAGVGARSLSECLLLQLRGRKKLPPGVRQIVKRFLPELGRKRYTQIAGELRLTKEQVQQAADYIAALTPYPGRAFQSERPVASIRPDIFVVKREGKWEAVFNEYLIPRITVNQSYLHSLQGPLDRETQAYLQQKLTSAKTLLDGLANRQSLLRRCVELVLAVQLEFFEGTSKELAPMSLTRLAEHLSVHPSTASRSIRGKYLQCRQGTFPLKFFFSRAAGATGRSQQAVKQRIIELIGAEDSNDPLSDPKLWELLSAQGVPISRRAVTKYRIQLGIPDFRARKR